MEAEEPKIIKLFETKEEPLIGIYLGTQDANIGTLHMFRVLGGRACAIPGLEGFNEQISNLVKVGAVCKISYKGEVLTSDGALKHMADVLLIL